MRRFWENPYGLEFAVGIEDTFIPQVSPKLRSVDEYWWPLFSLLDWACRNGNRPAEDYLWHMCMYDLEPDGRGGLLRIETPVVEAFRSATERTSEL